MSRAEGAEEGQRKKATETMWAGMLTSTRLMGTMQARIRSSHFSSDMSLSLHGFQLEPQQPHGRCSDDCCNDRALTRRLLCADMVNTDAPCETRPLSGPPHRPSRFRSPSQPPLRRGAYTRSDPHLSVAW